LTPKIARQRMGKLKKKRLFSKNGGALPELEKTINRAGGGKT